MGKAFATAAIGGQGLHGEDERKMKSLIWYTNDTRSRGIPVEFYQTSDSLR